jgi:cytochrome c biogenesis protein CcmG/thiol:disulfide interchange protein DsbE
MPAFDAVARSHPEVLFLGVAVQDTEAAARQFAEEVAVSYPLGLDGDGAIAELYPTLGLPTTWFITADGMVAARWVGELQEDSLESLIEEQLSSG